MPDTQIAGLQGIPVAELQILRLAPEDTLLVRTGRHFAPDAMQRIAAEVKLLTGHTRVLVLGPGVAIDVLRPTHGAHAQTPGGGRNV